MDDGDDDDGTFAWEKKCFKTYASPVAYTIPRGGQRPIRPRAPREGARAHTHARPAGHPPRSRLNAIKRLNHEPTTRKQMNKSFQNEFSAHGYVHFGNPPKCCVSVGNPFFYIRSNAYPWSQI